MCICINCHFIESCSLYKIIELKHNINSKKKKKNDLKVFLPKQSIIKNEFLNTKKNEIIKDWDISECVNFLEKPGNWMKI